MGLALRGDEAAYARIMRHYSPMITKQMMRYTRNRLEQEELVQEVFVEAYKSLRSYKARAPFEHWLRRIATNVGYQFWRKKGRRQQEHSLQEADVLRILHSAEPIPPSDAGEIVHQILQELPLPDRQIVTLIYLEGLSLAETAERIGWTTAVVKVRAFRARKRLRKVLDRLGIGMDDIG